MTEKEVSYRDNKKAEITSVLETFYAGTATGLVLALIPFIAVEHELHCKKGRKN